MLRFHASVHSGVEGNESALPVTFDEAMAGLQSVPRLFIEPDGSFVWTGTAANGLAWQVDGNLIDRGDALAYVELKGCCPEAQFDRLLATFGWPATALAFQLPQRGVMLSETEFREQAASEAGAV
jgi:hypothetical protein